ncbi:MAG: hypothetical protein ACRD1B_08395, partial [Thermoanaerobaculia bacterium]
LWRMFLTPFTLGPWIAALLAASVTALRGKGAMVTATECLRCGRAFCRLCRRAADSPLYCTDCVRLHIKKEPVGIEAHVAQAEEIRRRTRWRDRLCRLGSLGLPGAHDLFSEKPVRGAVRLFVFALALAFVVAGETHFNPRQLPPESDWRGTALVGGLAAFVIWASANLAAWRGTHGS